jgi:peptide/nickel transport system substrate-binding protein
MTKENSNADVGNSQIVVNRKLNRRQLLQGASLIGAGALAGPLLSAYGAGAAAGSGIFVIAYTSGIDTLNPFATIDVIPAKIAQLIYPYLVNVTAPGAPLVPDFSRSWSVSPDGLQITFKTRTNGAWSDGKPITAADVAFTINTIVRLQGGVAANLATFVDGITHVQATTPSTVVVHYSKPTASALINLASLAVLPEHIWRAAAKGSGARLKTFQVTTGAITGGPFDLSQYAQNQAVVLGANSKSYAKPHVTEIGYQSSSSETGAIQALSNGEASALDAGAVVPEGLSSLGAHGYKVNYQPGLVWYEIAFNSNPAKTHHRELLDPRVRSALSLATDRQRIVNTALFGHGQPGSTIIPPAMGAWHNGDIPVDPFDLDRANHMLDQLGYTKGSDGVRTANGHPMSYRMPLANDMPYQPIFDIISQDWGKVGVQIQGQPLDGAAEYLATTNPNGKYLDNDVSMWWWAAQVDPNFFLGLLTKAQLDGYSDTGYVNAKYDQLFTEQSTTLDASRRATLIHQMQAIANRDKPYLVLCYVDAFSAVSTKWAGVPTSSTGDFTSTSKQWALSLHQV